MALEVKIGSNVQGAVKGIQDVSLKLKDQQSILKNLQVEYARLDTAAARSKAGQLIATDIKIAKEEISRLGAVSASSFGQVGTGATKALGAVRGLANILPGIGIAGLIGGLTSLVAGLFESAEGFSKTELAAARFTQAMKDSKNALDELGDSLDFGAKFEKLRLELQGLSGLNLQSGGSLIDVTTGLAKIQEINNEIGKLNKTNDELVRGFTNTVQTLNKIGVTSKLSKLALEFKGLENIPASLSNVLPDTEKAILSQFTETNNRIKELTKQRLGLFREGSLSLASIPLGIAKELNKEIKVPAAVKIKPKKLEIRPELGSIDIVLPTFLDPKEDLRSRLTKQLENLFKDLNLKIPIGVDLSLPGKAFQNLQKSATESVEKIRNQLIADANAIANAVSNVLAPAFSSFFNAILEGKDPLKAFFQSLIQSIQQVISQLIAAAIKALVLRALTGGSSAGIGAIFGALAGRASGGPVEAGVPYLVGEHRAEVFVPRESGRIEPSVRAAGVSASQLIKVHVVGSIDGRTINLVQSRQSAYERRNV